ncbi:hypothetical protein Tco_1420390 [Tanacetum coccineum]
MMMAFKSYKKHLAHKALYDALIQSLFMDEDDINQAAAMDQSTQLKRKHDGQDEDSTFVTAKEPDEEHVHNMSLDVEENIIDEIGNMDEQPDGEAAPNTDNAPKNNWFKHPLRPPTPDPEWNKCHVVDDQP